MSYGDYLISIDAAIQRQICPAQVGQNRQVTDDVGQECHMLFIERNVAEYV